MEEVGSLAADLNEERDLLGVLVRCLAYSLMKELAWEAGTKSNCDGGGRAENRESLLGSSSLKLPLTWETVMGFVLEEAGVVLMDLEGEIDEDEESLIEMLLSF